MSASLPAKSLPVIVESVKPAAEGTRFQTTLQTHGALPLTRGEVSTLQINVGKLCNMACHHCHVEAGPKRTEIMSERVALRLVELLAASPSLSTVDLTGGAPELNRHFRELVRSATGAGRHVIDRCNLTVLFEPGLEDLPEFLANHRVEIVASLPCYSEGNVEKQRGKGAFDKSIEALRRLNRLGYGQTHSKLTLNLVYNPVGPFLPPAQQALETQYKAQLADNFGIVFNRLLTITNMPIKRFAQGLMRDGKLEAYMSLLATHFNRSTIAGLMCRSLVSVGHDGSLYDCDFNQMLDIPLGDAPTTIWDISSFSELSGRHIATADHCFGCTAGSGSSCGGALQ